MGQTSDYGGGPPHRNAVSNKLTTTAEANASRLGEEDIGLEGLWKYSEVNLMQFPSPPKMASHRGPTNGCVHLERGLPFRVHIQDQHTAAKIFDKNGPEIRCDDLSSLINVLIMSYEAGLDEEDTKRSCQKFDDLLFTFVGQICNGVQLEVHRKISDNDASAGLKLQSDFTMRCNGCLVLCGEERSGATDIGDTLAELESKMQRWNPKFSGELPYILGYVANGNHRQLFAFRYEGGDRFQLLCESSSTVVIKVFYNLAFILSYMAVQSKLTSQTLLSPFEFSHSDTGTIELVDGMLQLTTRCDHCESDGDYKRIVGIYKTLRSLRIYTLQSVESFNQSRFPSRKIEVKLSPTGFYRLPENVEEVETWLENMLNALQAWHASCYCHGGLGWDSIVYVPQQQITKHEVLQQPGYWVLVNMESSRRSRTEHREGDFYSWENDLNQLGRLLDGFQRSNVCLPHRLLWIRDKLLSARDKTEEVTAKKVLVMLNQTKNCRAEDLQAVAKMILSVLHHQK